MANTSKITISKSGDPSKVGGGGGGLPPDDPNNGKNSNQNDSNEKVLQQLQDINQNTMDSADAIAKTNTSIAALTESINNLKEATSKAAIESSANKKSTHDDQVFAARLEKVKAENAILTQKANEAKQKATEEAAIRQTRLQQAQFNLARSQELASQQNEDRARRLAENAGAQLKKEREEAGKYGPLAAASRGVSAVYNAQSGPISKSITAALTGGIGNLIGLDKVVSAAGSGLGKLVGGIVGKPFQAMAQKREQNKADQKAIDNAVHAAELNKRIQDILKAKGLDGGDSGNAKDNKKKNGGATEGASKDNPMRGVEERLDKIHNTLVNMSKGEKKEEKKEEEGFFSKIMSIAGFLIGAIKNVISSGFGIIKTIIASIFGGVVGKGLASLATFAGKGLASLGGTIIHGITAAAPVIAPVLAGAAAFAIGGMIGKVLAEKTVNYLDENTNLMGGKNAKASMNVAAGVSKKENKDAAQMAGGMAEFDLLNTQYEQNKEELEAGKLWGKSDEKVAQWRSMRARAARNSLNLSGYGKVAEVIDNAVKNKQISKEQGEELLIKRAKEITEEEKKKNEGRDLEEVKAENKARIENHNVEVADAEKKQNFDVKENENSVVYGDTQRQAAAEAARNQTYTQIANEERQAAETDPEMASVHEKVAEQYEKMTEFTGAMRTWSENDDMYAVEINKDLLTNSGQLSEEGILILKRQGVSDQQMSQIQNIIGNSTSNSSSNVYQTNITQHSDAPVYATGDAARTMNMN